MRRWAIRCRETQPWRLARFLSMAGQCCTRKFGSHAAVMIHLESGSCASSVVNDDIDSWAFKCRQHRHYTNGLADEPCYRCPVCESNFRSVSALFQHIESPACDADYQGAIHELQRYLANQVATFDSSVDTERGSVSRQTPL